jgi:AraC family transcriptional regulator
VEVEQILYRSERFTVGEVWCPPAAERFRCVTLVEGGPFAVFPGRSVVVKRVGGKSILVNANHVLFYNPGERYARRLHDPAGTRCVYVELRGEDEVPVAHGPCAADAYYAKNRVIRLLRSSSAPDPLVVEEEICGTLDRVIDDAFALHRVRTAERASTREAHRELVEAAKALLTERSTERLSLEEIGKALDTSPFHLARVFRAATGFTLHAYRAQLRLRLALQVLGDAPVDLRELAQELGYASHSHFTDSFRGTFGVAPSAVRAELSR